MALESACEDVAPLAKPATQATAKPQRPSMGAMARIGSMAFFELMEKATGMRRMRDGVPHRPDLGATWAPPPVCDQKFAAKHGPRDALADADLPHRTACNARDVLTSSKHATPEARARRFFDGSWDAQPRGGGHVFGDRADLTGRG